MSRYDDDNFSRGRSSHNRDKTPDYTYAGSGAAVPPYEVPGGPTTYGDNTSVASPGYRTYDGRPTRARLTYEPPRSASSLQVPESQARPRSLPPPIDYRRSSRETRRGRRHRRHDDSDDSDIDRARSPIDKARHFADNTFTNSPTGLGVGVLGALVGGLAAKEAADATSRHSNNHHHDPDNKRNQIISTVVGAAVGALGANAIEKRLDANREKDKVEQKKPERKWRPKDDVYERREVVVRPTSRGSSQTHDWDPLDKRDRDRDRGRVVERDVDPDARSWKNVEDWLYDDRNSTSRPRSSGQRSLDSYRY